MPALYCTFTLVNTHPQVVLRNPTLVDATWTVTTPGVRPKTAGTAGADGGASAAAPDEARFGAFIVRPAGGILPGRGLHLPKTQVRGPLQES